MNIPPLPPFCELRENHVTCALQHGAVATSCSLESTHIAPVFENMSALRQRSARHKGEEHVRCAGETVNPKMSLDGEPVKRNTRSFHEEAPVAATTSEKVT